jgi:small subunit ribosomal protein S8
MSPIIDLMIRIKNGYMAGREKIVAKHSRFSVSVLEKLKKLGYIADFTIEGDIVKEITVELKYDDTVPAFTDVKIISKPGQRIYIGVNEAKPVMSGFGYSILSTPKGILTNIEAKKQNTGGELLFNIW